MTTMMQFRASLLDSKPPIWRRLILHPRLALDQLHTALQHSFGWTNSHLHQFHAKDGTRYEIPAPRELRETWGKPALDERKVLLADFFDLPKKSLIYEYDFGDSWMHMVQFEKMVDNETLEYPFETFVKAGRGVFSDKERAAVCIGGARTGPPEDCGGIFGLQRILDLKANPPHPTAKKDAHHRDILEWLGEWDPDVVDLSQINEMLGRMRVKKANKE